MDPDATLREALEALVDYRRGCSVDDLESARLRFEALAGWLGRGGFAPTVTQTATGVFRVGR